MIHKLTNNDIGTVLFPKKYYWPFQLKSILHKKNVKGGLNDNPMPFRFAIYYIFLESYFII